MHYTSQQRFELEWSACSCAPAHHRPRIPDTGSGRQPGLRLAWPALLTIRDPPVASALYQCLPAPRHAPGAGGRPDLPALTGLPLSPVDLRTGRHPAPIPRRESFGDIDTATRGLVALPTEVRNGLIYGCGGVDAAGPAPCGRGRRFRRVRLADYHFFRQHVRNRGLQLETDPGRLPRRLPCHPPAQEHRRALLPDALATSDRLGDHIRSAVARNEIAEAIGRPAAGLDLRHHATFAYTLFPNAI